ncbi:ribosome-releasing factor 2, mitochondrial [[Candida] anglica]|uniref:Ribosome-releasing factor 2, mitochondrial n=1 Tax=[Candida] anglica TaxID=148631 RepID=A0ABP0EFJ9_9ASCO
MQNMRLPLLSLHHSLRVCTTRTLHTTNILYNESVLNSVPINRTRNIGIIAHIDAGKTTTTERMLFYSGKTNRIGNVDEGDTVTDYLPAERDRGITIQSAATTIPWNNHKINIIDTPGHADFTFEVIRSLRVLDGCVTILDAVAGVEAQTEKVWKQAQELGIPKICYVNKMDREGAGFSRTVKEIIQKLQTRVVLCNIPYFEEVEGKEEDGKFIGVLDILHKKMLKWKPDEDETGRDMAVFDIVEGVTPPEIYEMVYKSRESMIETLGEVDDALIDSFFENDEDYMKVPSSVINQALQKATLSKFAVPVFCGSSFKNIGVQPLMDAITTYLPSPLQINLPEVTSEKSQFKGKGKKKRKQATSGNDEASTVEVPVSMDAKKGLILNKSPNLTAALAFKCITHPIRGPMTFIRVYSGMLKANTTIINTRSGKTFKLGKLLLMHGDQPETISSLSSGNIGVITGMADEIVTGDTIVSLGTSGKGFGALESNLKMMPIEIPPPVFSASVEPLTAGDERFMDDCIQVLRREDPSLHVNVDEETGQTVLSGMGELHLEIVGDRLCRDLKAKAQMGKVVVTYKETLTTPSNTTTYNTGEEGVSVSLSLDSYEGPSEETDLLHEDGSFLLEMDNNVVVIEPSATPQHILSALEERRWKSEFSMEQLHDSMIQGCVATLQTGGPITRLPLHSTVIRISKWDFPVEGTSVQASQLLTATRYAVSQAINSHFEKNNNNFTLLEPIMNVKVFVNSDTMGEVVHDLNSQRKAIIHSIEDENENLETASWAATEAEKVYLPPDYTMSSVTSESSNLRNKKRIDAQAPLKEMIGYLSKFRSITQGRGAFDMTYHGMMRASKDRVDNILNEL